MSHHFNPPLEFVISKWVYRAFAYLSLRPKPGVFAIDGRRRIAMSYDLPHPTVTWYEPQVTACFANSGLQPTNAKQFRVRRFPPASALGAD